MLTALQTCPRHLLVCEKSSFLQERSRHSAHVETHYYNYCVSICLPECRLLPEKVKNIIDDFGSYYLVKNLPVNEFLTQEFNDRFLKKGLFYALSYNTRIDQDNVAAVLPTGKLILSVNKDTYEEMGLQGKPSLYSGKKAIRYIVTIDLSDSSMSPDGKKFQRVKWALTEKKPLALDFLVSWDPLDNSEQPSIQSYYSKYVVKECRFQVNSNVSRDLLCPVLKSDELHGKEGTSCSASEVFEWLGAISNEINCEYFNEPKLSQWVSIMVHGFADSPVSWRETEHGYFKGGENLYSFVIFNNEDYWLQMAVGTYDGCPP
ncbi:hypothetical protein GDO81_011730 [Engystomops pustulosus]|uniref:Uncharacterized protein n=1 Tax=Engystomops pustulosus TaxID=76066 RepID=A0AAV7BGN1_ENGPU|nr:hypothetical protein GDO81_011730 [Engystomops pustulosus]